MRQRPCNVHRHWHSFAFICIPGHSWALWSLPGPSCTFLAPPELSWAPLGTHGPPCRNLGQAGTYWASLGPLGLFWFLLGPLGPLCTPLALERKRLDDSQSQLRPSLHAGCRASRAAHARTANDDIRLHGASPLLTRSRQFALLALLAPQARKAPTTMHSTWALVPSLQAGATPRLSRFSRRARAKRNRPCHLHSHLPSPPAGALPRLSRLSRRTRAKRK